MHRGSCLIAALALAAAGAFATPSAEAQGRYPNRSIRLVVASAPGGVHDVIARLWADGLKSSLGTIIIDNRGGAGGIIGITEAARGTPDGYTLLLGSNSTHVLIPLIAKQPGFDPVKDFELATVFSITSTAIAVHPGSPIRTLKELIDTARANPGKLSFAHAGVGSISHVAGEMFKQLAGGLNILPVPYKGMGPAQTDVVNGTVSMFVPNITGTVIGLHNGDKIRILAINAPAGTPRAVLDRVNEATQQAMADKEFQQRLSNAAFDPMPGLGPEQSRAYMAEEFARWRKVVEAAGIRS
jgi:tripartite-type tricarboxylate transporter receptor subunit TctC